ncbi:MAG: DUF924 family protein [Arenimonas sp.]
MTHEIILHFWFREITPSQWWIADPEFDRLITERFAEIHAQAVRCELFEWRRTPEGRLAEIIILDQFSRNIYRNSRLAFANDTMALALAQEAVSSGADSALTQEQRNFLYMPYMHSESRRIHETAVPLFLANGLQNNHDFALRHKAIIDRFGRYPHRNGMLERQSSPEEIAFLALPDSSF